MNQQKGFRVRRGVNAEIVEVKRRQRERRSTGRPKRITNEMLYDMLSDVLENQAYLENEIRKLRP